MKGGGLFFNLLYPPRCIGCDKWFAWGSAGWWCEYCERARHNSGPFERSIGNASIYSAHHYTCAPVARAVHTIKYEFVHAAVRVCASWLVPLATDLQNKYGEIVIIPVPLHARREAERGFNQTSLIARELCRQSGAHCDETVLRRVIYTQAQAKSDGVMRALQLQDAFHVSRMCDPVITYVIFDDVVTTGSTLLACIATLRAAGAVHVVGLTIATTA